MDKKLLTLLIIIVSASLMYFISSYSQTKKIACTMEAKICPDGSAVGRTGPNCEFTPCPTIKPKPIITPSSIPVIKYQCPKTNGLTVCLDRIK